jgi:hypothetical protein
VHTTSVRPLIGLALFAALSLSGPAPLGAARGELELHVIDAQTKEPIAVEFQLQNERGRTVAPAGVTRNGRWLAFDGQVLLQLPPGRYSFRMRRGLEYGERTGHFLLKSGDADRQTIDLPRFVSMAEEGWWSGDLYVNTNHFAGLAARILAGDLHLVCLTTRVSGEERRWPADIDRRLSQGIGHQRAAHLATALDPRQGSITLLMGSSGPPAVPPADQPLPTPFAVARQLRAAAGDASLAHVHLAHVTCWDLPVWIAHDLVDSVGVLHDGLQEASSVEMPADRPRDQLLFPDPDGIGRWAQHVYFQLLESGVRVPPAAGSGSDGSGNPLGYSRVYVHCGEQFLPATWWDGLHNGRVVVTNGPLLRPQLNGQLPGQVFRGRPGETLSLEVTLQLSTQDKVRYLEIIQNGRPVHQVRLEDWVKQSGQLPPVVFDRSGWVLVRAVAEHPRGYRAALSGPYYVEFDEPRISRKAAEFFLDWVYQGAQRIRLDDPEQQRAVLLEHRQARDFWRERVDRSTVD